MGRAVLSELPFSLNCPRAVRLALAPFAVRREAPARDLELRLRDDVADFRAELLLFAIPPSCWGARRNGRASDP